MVYSWTDMKQVAMGAAHSVGLREDGTVAATGDNTYGQCDVEEWNNIVFIDASENCTIGITEDGTLMMAGSLL